ncbi:hypothetical protein C8R43DRAFT_901737 [Mycena crocata]|nr:hypothetical protein C8R43DRAFT_901737 [Mycena crocata]
MSGDASTNEQNVPPGVAGQAEVIKKCTGLVQLFRDGKVTKSAACTRIMQAIPSSFVEEGPGQQAAESYFEMLDIVERELADAANRGRASPPPDGRQRHSRSPSPHDRRGSGRHRSRSGSPDDRSGSKRYKVDHSKLPWLVGEAIVQPTLTPELTKTRDQLIEYAKNPKYILSTVLNSAHHVAFPESEWLAIIKGEPVDLNKVIASQFSVSHEHKRTETIGNGVEILFGSSVPTKVVNTQSEWVRAWSKTAQAIVFIFPHRRSELEIYRDWIIDLFASSADYTHDRIIRLDRKIRNEAAGRRDLALSECLVGVFSHWERSFLSDHGTAYLESKSQTQGSGRDGGSNGSSNSGGSRGEGQKKSKEPCRRFNDDNCPSNKNTCRYAHICIRCKRSHPVSKCNRPPAVPE